MDQFIELWYQVWDWIMMRLLTVLLSLLWFGCEGPLEQNNNEGGSSSSFVYPTDSLSSQILPAQPWIEHTNALDAKIPLDFYRWQHNSALVFQLGTQALREQGRLLLILMDSIGSNSVNLDQAFDLMRGHCIGGVSELAGHGILRPTATSATVLLGIAAAQGDFRPCALNSKNGLLLSYNAVNAGDRIYAGAPALPYGKTYAWVLLAYDSTYQIRYSSPLRYLHLN